MQTLPDRGQFLPVQIGADIRIIARDVCNYILAEVVGKGAAADGERRKRVRLKSERRKRVRLKN
ncbi:MAG: hypothetical protein HZA16_03245 [Nitrospirae bacterium]|nr:hypothetical protein [Nitrospirota bacterium]